MVNDAETMTASEWGGYVGQIRWQCQFVRQLHRSSASIMIGSVVMFEAPDGRTIRGIVVRRNRKTVTIHTDDGKHWNVSPTLVRLTGQNVLDEVAPKDGRVVPFTEPAAR
jgi:hypothetical protein